MRQRVIELDILRAFAIILIVFSHFPPLSVIYIDPVIKYWAAIIGISLFLFISGLVLHPPANIQEFYHKRALRIYPPYLIILGIYVAIQYAIPNIANSLGIYLSPIEIFINAVGLQALLNVPSYGVLWFVGLIIVYYMIYPFLGTKQINILIISSAALVLFVALHQFGLIIPQLIYYWPVFIAGVLLSRYIPTEIPLLSFFSTHITRKPLLFIASISYAIYLTHLLILSAMTFVLSGIQTDLILVFIGIPAIIIFSYVLTWSGSDIKKLTVISVVVLIFLISLVAAPISMPTPIDNKNVTNVTIIGKNATSTTSPKYMLYFFTMAAPCPAGVKMEKDVAAWAKAHPTVMFNVESADGSLGVKYDVRISPTTVMLKDGKVVGRWVGIFDVNLLDSSFK